LKIYLLISFLSSNQNLLISKTMAKSLPPGFKLSEGDISDSDEIWQLCEDAFGDDEIWQVVFKGCKKEDIHLWVMSVLSPRWNLPDITLYKIVEESTGYVSSDSKRES
jgi:hypothetical protein